MKCNVNKVLSTFSALCCTTVLLGGAEKLPGAPAYWLGSVANAQQHR